jgi:integrase
VEKVTQLHINRVYDGIKIFFDDIEEFSHNTRTTYERHIKDFFMFLKSKELQFLTESDLDIVKNDVLKFRKNLVKSEKYANRTINQKVAAVKSLYVSLKSNKFNVDPSAFESIRDLPEKQNHRGTLTAEEAQRMADLARTTERQLKEEKYFLIMTAIRTSIRLGALLKLEWSDIKEKETCYIVEVYDKGNKLDEKPITKEFYKQLSLLKQEGRERVFYLSKDAVNDMMGRLRELMGFEEERNITFHSFKNVGVNYVLDVTNDPEKARQQGNHSSIQTTYKYYVDKNKDYSQMAGMLMDNQMDISMLEEYSKEQIIEAIIKCSQKTQIEVLDKLSQTVTVSE